MIPMGSLTTTAASGRRIMELSTSVSRPSPLTTTMLRRRGGGGRIERGPEGATNDRAYNNTSYLQESCLFEHGRSTAGRTHRRGRGLQSHVNIAEHGLKWSTAGRTHRRGRGLRAARAPPRGRGRWSKQPSCCGEKRKGGWGKGKGREGSAQGPAARRCKGRGRSDWGSIHAPQPQG